MPPTGGPYGPLRPTGVSIRRPPSLGVGWCSARATVGCIACVRRMACSHGSSGRTPAAADRRIQSARIRLARQRQYPDSSRRCLSGGTGGLRTSTGASISMALTWPPARRSTKRNCEGPEPDVKTMSINFKLPEGAVADILTVAGDSIIMHGIAFDENWTRQPRPAAKKTGSGQSLQSPGLSASSGFLDDSYFKRTPWCYQPAGGQYGNLFAVTGTTVFGMRMFESLQCLTPDNFFTPAGKGYTFFASECAKGRSRLVEEIPSSGDSPGGNGRGPLRSRAAGRGRSGRPIRRLRGPPRVACCWRWIRKPAPNWRERSSIRRRYSTAWRRRTGNCSSPVPTAGSSV